jgi:N-acyl-D-amino-acid deacylase
LNRQPLAAAAEHFGLQDVLEAARKLYLEDEGRTLASSGGMSMADIERILAHDYTAVSTDSWTKDSAPTERMSAHPRDFGTFARVLGEFTRDRGVLTLEEAVRKLTSLPAAIIGLEDRGVIKQGAWADITVFDPENVANRATFPEPWQYPAGIEHVVVNGELALRAGERTDSLSGRVLCR